MVSLWDSGYLERYGFERRPGLGRDSVLCSWAMLTASLHTVPLNCQVNLLGCMVGSSIIMVPTISGIDFYVRILFMTILLFITDLL